MKNSILGKARWLREVALATSKNNGARVAQEWLKYAAMFVMLLTLGIGNVWGADVTGTINFGSASGSLNINSASVSGDDDLENSWTVTTVGTTSFTPNAAYAQVGAKKSPATSITFTTTLPSAQTIKSMSAKFGGFSGTAGTVTLKVGDNSIGTGSLNETSDVTVSSTDGTKSGTVLTVTVTEISRGVKCYYISYTYSTGGGCDKEVTLAQSVTNGTATFDPAGPVATCSATASDRQVSVSITPTTGYALTSGPTVSGIASATISGSGPYTIQLPQNGNGTLTLSATCSAIAVTGVSLNKNSTTIAEGSTETLTATVSPSNALNKAVTWSTNAPGVATVNSSGVVTAVSAGSATITVTTTDGSYTATCAVTVTAAVVDRYIDNIWEIVTPSKAGTYTRPTLSDQTPGGLTDCQHLHYHFAGWVTETYKDSPSGHILSGGSVTADGSTYYAVWEKEASGSGGANVYTLVEETLSDWSGSYIFTDPDKGHAMSNSLSSGKFGSKTVTPSNNQITSTDGDIIWVVTKGTGDNASKYSVYNASANKYANNGNSSTSASLSDNAVYLTFTRDETYGDVAIKGANGRWFSYYSDKEDFRTYNRSSDYGVYLYRNSVSYEDPIASCGAEYTITIDKNNASATCTSCGAKVTANATALSNLVVPTWTGHQVDYYMVASEDNSTKIAEADGSLVASVTVSSTPWTDANGKWVKGGDATFYAKWKATECVITLNNEGADSGHEGTASVTATYGANTNLTTSINTPTKNGYDFGGYYTAANGSGVKLINADGSWVASASGGGNTYTNASKQWQYDATALELHAQWTLKSYTVTWVVNGETEATQTSVSYGTAYSALTEEPDVADNALSDCGSDKFVGWVTQEYTAEGGTAAAQYDPYKVIASTLIDDNNHTFYAMFAKEEGTAFTLEGDNGSTQELNIYAVHSGTAYYATGVPTTSGSKISSTSNASLATTYTFTKINTGTYSIKSESDYIAPVSGKTDLKKQSEAFSWTITTGTNGTWRIYDSTRGFTFASGASSFGNYALSNITSASTTTYYDVELGSSNLTNYRTGCCDEKITLAVSDATSGAGGTVTLKWNNADKSAGDQVSTCSAGTLVAKVTANPGYILTAMAISGTNKSITITPSDLTTGLPSTEEMTYSVAVQALATGTLTITPTFSHTYTVTYDLADGETSGSTATVRYQSGETVTLVTPAPTKSGYNFTGWTVTKEGGGNVTVSGGKFTMPADNVTATATWAEKTLTSINLGSASVEVYVGQYVEIPVTYDPADILTKNYTLVANPSYCVTTNSTITTLKITGGRAGVTITENKTETVSIKANADNSKTASVSVTVKPLPVDHYVDLIHGVSFDDKGSTIVNNELSATYTAPGYGDYSGSTTGDCETNHLHLVGWIESEWADAHPKATHAEIIAAEGYHTAREAGMTASNKTYYAVWGDEQ